MPPIIWIKSKSGLIGDITPAKRATSTYELRLAVAELRLDTVIPTAVNNMFKTRILIEKTAR